MLKDRFYITKPNYDKKAGLSYFINSITKEFYSELLTEKDSKLLNLVFKDNISQEDLDKFLKDWDIEVVGGHKALMLSYFMKIHPELNYPKYIKPRLNGLLDYYRFQNIKLISQCSKICNALKQNNIDDILILKGGAMKHLRPEFSRIMNDIDIMVHEKDYEKAGKLVKSMGYDADWYPHSFDIHPKGTNEGLLDIHRHLDMGTGYETTINDNLFKRATKQKVFNVDLLVPSHEDIVFIALVNLEKNLFAKTSMDGILYSLFDCKFLIDSKRNFDWNIVIQNAIDTKTEHKLLFGINFINNIVPNLIPDKIKKNDKFEKKFKDYCIIKYFKRFLLDDMKQHSHALKIQDAIKHWHLIKEYLSFKPKYLIYKQNFIKNNPVLAKTILNLEKRLVCN